MKRFRVEATGIVCLGLLACCVERPQDPSATNKVEMMGDLESEGGSSNGLQTVRIPLSIKGKFASRAPYGDKELILNGSGLCEWGFLKIDIYRAALYVERRPTSVKEALAADQIMAIHLEFARKLTGKQLQEAYSASVRINTGKEAPTYEKALAKLVGCMRTARPRDAYTFISDPERGLLVQRDGTIVAQIEDDRFRKLFVSLYLGEKPPTKALRKGLLGGVR